jgi:hypothetical protein
MFKKFPLLAVTAIAALSLLPQPVAAQGKKDSVVMAMALEPPGLDPTAGRAAVPRLRLQRLRDPKGQARRLGCAIARRELTSPA